MIVCSCTVISDQDLEAALIEIMSGPSAPVPTPGVVFRHLARKMHCCGCVRLVVDTIYDKLETLEAEGRICPYRSATAKARLVRSDAARPRIDFRAPPARLAAE